ncbi:MAG: glycosyltransferase family 9 protein [Bryobacterales bacterium]|nr:glycosyltransferase family 9 protein [Bryobacterales bacterium]
MPALSAIGPRGAEVWAPGPVLPLLELAARRRNLASTGFSLLGIPGALFPEGLVDTLRGFDEILSWSGGNQPELKAACERLCIPVQFFEPLPRRDSAVHVSDWFLRQTRPWHGLDAEPEAWRSEGGRRFLLPALAMERTPARPLRVVLHPFSGSARKNWPLSHYLRLARSIAAHLGREAVIQWCAGPEDTLPEDLGCDAWRFEKLDDLARALASSALFIGNDSGITHLAAMLGIPCVVFFGPEHPRVWAPRGARVRLLEAPGGGQPASAIPFERGEAAVFSVLTDLLEK